MSAYKERTGSILIAAALATGAWSVAGAAQAANYSQTETIVYHDDRAQWVLGQVKSVTNVNTGQVVSQTVYGWKALPTKTYSFGKLQQTLGYYTTGTPGNVSSVTDGRGNKTTLSNWKRGIPQKITYADGATESAVVNNDGTLASVTDANGFKTGYAYDAMGRLSQITYPTGDSTAWNKTTQAFARIANSEYGIAAGHWRQIVKTGNHEKVVYFDALWRPLIVRERDIGNSTATLRFNGFAYDAKGRTVFEAYPAASSATIFARGTRTTYDALDRPTYVKQDSELGPLTTRTEYLNNADGAYTKTTNPRTQVTRTWYQAFDRSGYDAPVKITHPEGVTTHIARDVFGKPTSIKRSGGGVTATRHYVYDGQQQLCKTVEPETGATVMAYDAAGNLAWSKAGSGHIGAACNTADIPLAQRTTRSYDARNRIKTLTFPDHRGDTTYNYTPDGLLQSVTADNGGTSQVTTTYSYNKRRLPTRELQAWPAVNMNWAIDHAYNANGHLVSHRYPGNLTVNYAPNALGQPTQAGPYASGVSYHPNGAIKQFTYGNGIKHTLTQNARGLPDRSLDAYGTAKVLDDGYDFDANGNVAAISDGLPGARGDRTMSYDGLDRLRTVASPMYGTPGATYAYDALDNLTRVKIGGTATRDRHYCYDTKWRLTNVKTGSCSGTSVIGLGYDLQGNLANKNGQVFDFDHGNRLRSAKVGTTTSTYVYDGHGRRVRDFTAASKFSQYSQAGQLMFDQDGRKKQQHWYIHLGGSLVAVREKNTTTGAITNKYQHTDALGSPVAVTDANRTVIEKSEYEPYGTLLNRPLKDGPGYTGHVADAATGLNYMQQRYYDPGIGRFLSVDPVTADSVTGANFNRYWYANNNPYAFIDPDGRFGIRGNTPRDIPGAGEAHLGESISGVNVNSAESIGMANIPRSWKQADSYRAQARFNPDTAIAANDDEPPIPLARNVSELLENTYERIIRRTSLVANGGFAAGPGIDFVATKTTRPWQNDKAGAYLVLGMGGYLGANAKFRTFSWGDQNGTTGGSLKGNPLGYFRLKIGAGLSVGLTGSFNDQGGGTLNVTLGGGLGAQAIVKPPATLGWEAEL